MTLHKTDHLSEKDIQKRKSTFSNFELQAAFFLALISKSKRLMMSEDFFYSFDILQKVSKYSNHCGWIIKTNLPTKQSLESFGAKIQSKLSR